MAIIDFFHESIYMKLESAKNSQKSIKFRQASSSAEDSQKNNQKFISHFIFHKAPVLRATIEPPFYDFCLITTAEKEAKENRQVD